MIRWVSEASVAPEVGVVQNFSRALCAHSTWKPPFQFSGYAPGNSMLLPLKAKSKTTTKSIVCTMWFVVYMASNVALLDIAFH